MVCSQVVWPESSLSALFICQLRSPNTVLSWSCLWHPLLKRSCCGDCCRQNISKLTPFFTSVLPCSGLIFGAWLEAPPEISTCGRDLGGVAKHGRYRLLPACSLPKSRPEIFVGKGLDSVLIKDRGALTLAAKENEAGLLSDFNIFETAQPSCAGKAASISRWLSLQKNIWESCCYNSLLLDHLNLK